METAVAYAITIFVFFAVKSFLVNDLSPERAREMIREGAVIIDVRSEDEYSATSLRPAVNIPLGSLGEKISGAVTDKERTVLLHCRSGSRSMIGKKTLKRMGYTKVYNLGSFRRAKKIINNA